MIWDWGLTGFPEPKPFADDHRIVTDAWKNQLRNAMQRAGQGRVFYGDDAYEWRHSAASILALAHELGP